MNLRDPVSLRDMVDKKLRTEDVKSLALAIYSLAKQEETK
jgi:hypothetical protein